MKHLYQVTGMTCNGCRSKVESVLQNIKEVESASVTLNPPIATIVMKQHITDETFQKELSAKGNYGISMFHGKVEDLVLLEKKVDPSHSSTKKIPTPGVYYCPMHCEGEKTYPQSGDCPVCGMDLVKEVSAIQPSGQFTCPMHPEIIRDEPGACPICGMDLVPTKGDENEESKIYRALLRKFKIAVLFTLPIFLIAMSEMIVNNPLPDIMQMKYWNFVQWGLSVPVVFYACWMFFERAWKSIQTRNLNMFTLIGIGAGVAWLFSVTGMLFPELFPDQFKTEGGSVHVYFEAATVILTLVLLGQLLEARAHSQTNSAVKELLKLAPNEAILVSDGEEHVISIDAINIGDFLRVKPGDKIPVDGSIVEGEGIVDESMITGEPIPVSKMLGDKISSGTINEIKSFVMKAEKIGADTLLSQIIHMVNQASRSKAPIQKLADRVSAFFVPSVLAVSVITFIVWTVYGPDPAFIYAFVNAIAVLIIACPCALGLATPMSVMVGVGKGAQSGVLIKNAEILEKLNHVDVLIIDKTGTLTEGKPSVELVKSVNDKFSDNEVLGMIASLNQFSEHQLADATMSYVKEKKVQLLNAEHFESVTGKGVKASINDQRVALGNLKMMEESTSIIPDAARTEVIAAQKKGKTVPYLSLDGEVVGYIVFSDAIKQSSKQAILALQQRNIDVVMLTGDNENTARAVANELNLASFQAECLPEDKMKEVKRLQSEGKVVAMAGDGINDAPALAQSDVGIAMGTGTDVAMESASITLVKGDLQGIVKAKKLSGQVMKNIKQNLFFAFFYNVIGIPIAAGVLFPIFGILLSPMIAALAMSFSSVSVIANALRLRRVKL